jgi:hypothetical protein
MTRSYDPCILSLTENYETKGHSDDVVDLTPELSPRVRYSL